MVYLNSGSDERLIMVSHIFHDPLELCKHDSKDDAIYTFLFDKKLRSSLSTENFSIFLLFSIVMRTITYCISIIIG